MNRFIYLFRDFFCSLEQSKQLLTHRIFHNDFHLVHMNILTSVEKKNIFTLTLTGYHVFFSLTHSLSFFLALFPYVVCKMLDSIIQIGVDDDDGDNFFTMFQYVCV